MTSRVYHLQSTLELPLDELYAYFEETDEFPGAIEDVEITRRNNTLILSAIASEDTVGKYTPTAQLKATVTESRVVDGAKATQHSDRPDWQTTDDVPDVKLIQIAAFKGDRETVLQNTALQYPMFEVLCDLAPLAIAGSLTAITADNGELVATRIVDGEARPASIQVVEDRRTASASHGSVDWRNNEYIRD